MAFLEPGEFLALAHRGGAYHPEIEGLENTLAAFQHAVDLGYRYLETDVHVTRDGVLLAFHDTVLDRVSDRVGAIADLTFAEIREARIGGREQVPTLVSLVEAFPDARFNIDLKAPGTALPLWQLIEQRGATPLFDDRRTLRYEDKKEVRIEDEVFVNNSVTYLSPVPGSSRKRAVEFMASLISPTQGANDDWLAAQKSLIDLCVSSLRWRAVNS
jgi:glycerophosphoryl diester phosphodiesterase